MATNEQWVAMTPEEKRTELEATLPEVSNGKFLVTVEGKPPKVAKFTVRRYTKGGHRPERGRA